MFAQMTVDNIPEKTKQSFKERVEKPVYRGLVLSTISGAFLGGLITFNVLMAAMTPATLAVAIIAGAAVGGSAGLLLFGLSDVVICGRLEEGAELVEQEEDQREEWQPDETRGQEDNGYALRKAS